MKNIHLIPTEKPSRLYLVKSNNKLDITSNNPEYTENFGSGTQNQHIYITSDEEIKDGDWYIFPIHKNGFVIKLYNSVKHFSKELCISLGNLKAKKIILTTDVDLIKDGVQAIDDEFLEWFVNNPSFKGVEVIYGLYNPSGRKVNFEILNQNHSQCVWKYKIIIPNEEPKCQHPTRLREYYHKNAFKCFECNKIITSTDIINPKSNKETLEEVKVPIGEFIINNAVSIQGADGAYYHYSEVCKLLKLQSQRMYSEEEVLNLLDFINDRLPDLYSRFSSEEELKEWFEQFKKK